MKTHTCRQITTLFQVTVFFLFYIKVQSFTRDPVIKEKKFQKGAKNNAKSKSHSVQIKALVVLLWRSVIMTLSSRTMSSSLVFFFVVILYKMLTVNVKDKVDCTLG